jgi:hypothetical protein
MAANSLPSIENGMTSVLTVSSMLVHATVALAIRTAATPSHFHRLGMSVCYQAQTLDAMILYAT